MTEHQYKSEQSEKAFVRDNYICQVCGKPATQSAHVLSDTVSNKKKYGWKVIHHHSNKKSACGIECNKKLEIKHKGGKMEAEQIYIIENTMLMECWND